MESLNFYIQYEKVRSLTFKKFKLLLEKSQMKTVSEITIRELSSTYSPNGLYFMFSSGGELAYVGKASSRSFIERIPSHFDQREHAWMNTVPKKILKRGNADTYDDALQRALDLQLVMMGFKDRTMSIRLETALRAFLQPRLNPGRKKVQDHQCLCEFES